MVDFLSCVALLSGVSEFSGSEYTMTDLLRLDDLELDSRHRVSSRNYERSAKRRASSPWFSGKKSKYECPGPTRHGTARHGTARPGPADTTRLPDAFDELISLQPRARMTNGLL